jgi:DNA modification methylase
MSLFPPDSFDYSSSSNSNIYSFISLHSNNSKYFNFKSLKDSININVPSFKKTGPVYAMHRYWTKQPIDIISSYIKFFCPPNGIVLDPFCGTGTTGTAALYSNRKVILSDLSPIATFIAKNYTEKTDISEISKSVFEIKERIMPKLAKYYSTHCSDCGSLSSIKDWIYSEKYECPNCFSNFSFVSDSLTWDDIQQIKHSKTAFCYSCNSEYNRDGLKTLSPQVLGLRFSCVKCKIRKKFKFLSLLDKSLLSDKNVALHQVNIQKVAILPGVSTNQAINKNIRFVNDFFTPITFFMLSEIWRIINTFPIPTRSKLQFIFSSIIYRVTKLYRLRVKGQGGILSGTLYIPPIFQDINVWDVFLERFNKISKGWHDLNKNLSNFSQPNRIVSTNSATNLLIPDNSIDYVYTDPPYGGNINYSELNFLWEFWFDKFTDAFNEVIINEKGQQKDLNKYKELFSFSLNEIYRVLKPNSWCSIVFNSSSPKIWSMVQNIIINSPFHMANEISSFGSKMTTAKQTQSNKTARKYVVLNLFKQSVGLNEVPDLIKEKTYLSNTDLTQLIIFEAKNLITSSPNQISSYNKIYEHVILFLLSKYSFSDFDLESILRNSFTQINKNDWTL